jgi:16S rRNA G966 N2-methylase RsmD
LVSLENVRGQFDLIFLDPPYRFDYGVKALEKIAQKGLLTDIGVAVYERDRAFEGEIVGLEKYDERKYGKTYLTFFRKEQKHE